jgi:hypothetical protein
MTWRVQSGNSLSTSPFLSQLTHTHRRVIEPGDSIGIQDQPAEGLDALANRRQLHAPVEFLVAEGRMFRRCHAAPLSR